MRRRAFIALLGGSAAWRPSAGLAQQPALPVIGFLDGWYQEGFGPYVAAFREGLEGGWLYRGKACDD